MKTAFLTAATVVLTTTLAVAQTVPQSSSGNAPSPKMNAEPDEPAANTANARAADNAAAAAIAKKAIEQDGYKNVQAIGKGSDGLWHADARRGRTQVHVTVDRTGTVSTQ